MDGARGSPVTQNRGLNCITPPFILRRLLEHDDASVRSAALATLLVTAELRGERSVRSAVASGAAPAAGRRTVFDCRRSADLGAGVLARSEDGVPSGDAAVNRAFDGFGSIRAFYAEVLGRNSIDDRGMRLEGYVHRGLDYNNAFWDGQKMVFGDGDGTIFTDFTASLDVIAHELAHGVTEHTAGLEYHDQPGALNESISDVFGSLVKQWTLRQRAEEADWMIGADVFTPGIQADALRKLDHPGSAYDNELFGKDPQPAHMDQYVVLPDTEDGDHGGVHVNSGIPNRAFHLAATRIGGFAWEAPGRIWYEALRASAATTDFAAFAETTCLKAAELFGAGGAETAAVGSAWQDVGIVVAAPAGASVPAVPPAAAGTATQDGDGTMKALTEQVAGLSARIDDLIRDVHALAGGSH
jgi:Zn-dependent metalloprotease